ncbi:hypothetical protein L2E82_12091 [Cichorium intybus]|uniref:Uncharacterized protein n=1 Tax=Cichorium intybus TaxID=13427 RepID=A0ACB9GF46_CICIN|nr:hypothetical protein L2E82_12091 [Cichorium intybus]
MALLRKFLYNKPHDGLVHVFERIYVTDYELVELYISSVIIGCAEALVKLLKKKSKQNCLAVVSDTLEIDTVKVKIRVKHHVHTTQYLLGVFNMFAIFDSCFRLEPWDQKAYKAYVRNVTSQFQETNPDSSFMIFNFWEADTANKIKDHLSKYYITTMDYPKHYEGCPLLSMEAIYHFLRSSDSWLSLGQQNVFLIHCELGGWPVLAFMLAALLLYRKHCTDENRALEMVHEQAPKSDLLSKMSPLDPSASQSRYLQYVLKRNAEERWLPTDKALKLDCVMIRMIPDFDGKGGCRPIFRIYGRDPLLHLEKTPKLLFSTPKRRPNVQSYNQEENELVKININCNIQSDIVLECINLDADMVKETIMYRVMFNTAFINSHMLIFNRDEIDVYWDKKNQFPKDFHAAVLLSSCFQ